MNEFRWKTDNMRVVQELDITLPAKQRMMKDSRRDMDEQDGMEELETRNRPSRNQLTE